MIAGRLKDFIQNHRRLVGCLILGFITFLVYGRSCFFEFTNYDDGIFVYENPHVASGLSWPGIVWALTTGYFDFWHPVTWWSHMLDCQLFGLSAGWHHFVNVLFHSANTLLLFGLFHRLTGAFWRSATVAAVFALHPLHVESVAWVSERKDVLSGFFFLLTLWAYVRYVLSKSVKGDQQPEFPKPPPARISIFGAPQFYVVSLLFFALGLMSKAMLVTVPFVLLLLDFWPLERWKSWGAQNKSGQYLSLLLEKLPFFVLTLGSCIVTYLTMQSAGNILSAEKVSWGLRLANIPVAYLQYLAKLTWPSKLAVLYPRQENFDSFQVILGILVLALVTTIALLRWRRAPYLVFGWFMFLGMLVPVIGIVANGLQSIADRYTYLPSIGLTVAVVWAAAELFVWRQIRKVAAGFVIGAILLVYGILTWMQLGSWRDSFTLWRRCLAVTRENSIAEYNFGVTLRKAGQTNEALVHFREAVRIKPEYEDANNLGVAYAINGQLQEATNYFALSLHLKSDYAVAHEDLGIALLELGNVAGAAEHCGQALRLGRRTARCLIGMGKALAAQGQPADAERLFYEAVQSEPGNPQALYLLGVQRLALGRYDEAAAVLAEAVRSGQDRADAHFQLAVALAAKGERRAALRQYRETLRLNPASPAALNNLAWILATDPDPTLRNGPEALNSAKQACEATAYKEAVLMGTLAAAYAENGQFEQAAATAQKAHELAAAAGQEELAKKNQTLRELFLARHAYRETGERVKGD